MDFGISLKKRKENTSKGVAMRIGRNYAGLSYSTLYTILILLLVVICCYRRCCCRRRGYVVVDVDGCRYWVILISELTLK